MPLAADTAGRLRETFRLLRGTWISPLVVGKGGGGWIRTNVNRVKAGYLRPLDYTAIDWTRGPDSNRRGSVLQADASPLCHRANDVVPMVQNRTDDPRLTRTVLYH